MRINFVSIDVEVQQAELKNAGETTKSGKVLTSPLMYSLVILPTFYYTDAEGKPQSIPGQKVLMSMPTGADRIGACKSWIDSVRNGATYGQVFGGSLKSGKDRAVGLTASERDVCVVPSGFGRDAPINCAVFVGTASLLGDGFLLVEERYPIPGKKGEWGSNTVPVYSPYFSDADLGRWYEGVQVLVQGSVAFMTVRTVKTLVIVADRIVPGRKR